MLFQFYDMRTPQKHNICHDIFRTLFPSIFSHSDKQRTHGIGRFGIDLRIKLPLSFLVNKELKIAQALHSGVNSTQRHTCISPSLLLTYEHIT